VLDSLFSTGFANLASTDAGFFGKGLYATPDAEYAYQIYSKGALLVNWMAVFSPYPVIAKDEEELAEMGNFGNYDAHFVPVYSENHPHTTSYHACEQNQVAQYSELVVFESSQMLPYYIVELQPNMPIEVPLLFKSSMISKVKPKVTTHTQVSTWTVADVCSWLSTLSLSQNYASLIEENKIDGKTLLHMQQEDWSRIGVNNFGDVRLLIIKINKMN